MSKCTRASESGSQDLHPAQLQILLALKQCAKQLSESQRTPDLTPGPRGGAGGAWGLEAESQLCSALACDLGKVTSPYFSSSVKVEGGSHATHPQPQGLVVVGGCNLGCKL